MSQAEVPQTDEEARHHHPTPRQYIQVAVILAIITAIEVGIYYIEFFEENSDLLIVSLLAFAFIKFMMVALWFMHLKFDAHLFRRFFITGVILALIIFGIVLWFFFTHGGPAPNVA
jgi:cytochrome c oxidase subunit IV